MAMMLKIQQTVVDEYDDDSEYDDDDDDDANNVGNNVEGATHCGGGEQP